MDSQDQSYDKLRAAVKKAWESIDDNFSLPPFSRYLDPLDPTYKKVTKAPPEARLKGLSSPITGLPLWRYSHLIQQIQLADNPLILQVDALGARKVTPLAPALRWITQRTLDKKPKSGRPRKLKVQEIRYVLVSLELDRRITCESLVNLMGGQVSRNTIPSIVERLPPGHFRDIHLGTNFTPPPPPPPPHPPPTPTTTHTSSSNQ
ncbi:Flavin-containing monooxygenase ustF2, partial [Fusarium oxysporum f. sp. albedinis]